MSKTRRSTVPLQAAVASLIAAILVGCSATESSLDAGAEICGLSAGCHPEVVFEGDATLPGTTTLGTDLAIDDSNIYFFNSGALTKVPKSGGKPTVLGGDGNSIATDGVFVYWSDAVALSQWSDQVAVNKVSVDGGAVTMLASATTGTTLALDDVDVYGCCFGVGKMPKTGGPWVGLSGPGICRGIATTEDKAYLAVDGSLLSVPIDVGTTTTLLQGTPIILGVAATADHVYAVVEAASNPKTGMTTPQQIISIPSAGGAPTKLGEDGKYAATSSLLVDATGLYYRSEAISLFDWPAGAIEKVALDGGPVEVLFNLKVSSSALQMDAHAFYYIDGDRVMRLER